MSQKDSGVTSQWHVLSSTIFIFHTFRYGCGTLPWGQAPPAAGFERPQIDDGLIEVIGLSSTTLAMIQVGGHGDHICQCRTVTLTTDKVIPMQMDGEPCRLMPATIQIRCSHQALVVQKQGHQPTYTTRSNNVIPPHGHEFHVDFISHPTCLAKI
ncbi:DAG kinase [Fasciola hepatica]|uniref:DAG kinase n=1 Tax=Fasciola hepatica TaxID=6192 RepID=A0A4E0RQH6_FASHE|nr:DAG kinase [Fasciola hepatica]